ncbi:nicotinate phosphoribosyltransferase [Ureaplasma canigenitalium]|uniref:hypothetical protein n=1 Tax=Ureaplasma canigenitalium TaxID=42092 RepID=UPI0004E209DF|nr:hypothetical protein [Ureaplasma canigenitalium]
MPLEKFNTKDIDFKFSKVLFDDGYTPSYDLKTTFLAREYIDDHAVCTQFLNYDKNNIMVCGTMEVIRLLEFYLSKKELKQLTIKYVPDGYVIRSKEMVLSIEGPYEIYGNLITIISSILTRRSSVATNAHEALNLIDDEQKIVFMVDYVDDYRLQPYDGYAAYVGGITNFVTEKQVEFLQDSGAKFDVSGSMTYHMISMFSNELSSVCHTFLTEFPKNRLIPIIDFSNNVINELENIRDYFKDIYAVRIDLSDELTDEGLEIAIDNKRNMDIAGTSPYLIELIRDYLDRNEGKHIKIVVASDLTFEDIRKFKKHQTAIDVFGLGYSLTEITVKIKPELMFLDGQDVSKWNVKPAKNTDDLIEYRW